VCHPDQLGTLWNKGFSKGTKRTDEGNLAGGFHPSLQAATPCAVYWRCSSGGAFGPGADSGY
jgi:hypothetical protein